MLLLGFTGLSHPSTLLAATREDLLLPMDTLSERPVAFLRIRDPKTRRYMVRQHLRVSDATTVSFLQRLYGHAPAEARLFDLGHGAFRLRWDRVFNHLGVPTREAVQGITPGSLRGSGATWLYNTTENIPLIRWRGRWRREATLECYLQDVAALLLLRDVSDDNRAKIRELAGFAYQVVVQFDPRS